jgi:hypothetical protein
MRRLSIKLEKSRSKTGWYYFSTVDKELHFIIKHAIPGLYLLLKSKGFESRLPVKQNVPVKEALQDFNGYFGFEYNPIKSNMELNVDILA